MRWSSFLLALCLMTGLRADDTVRISVPVWSTMNPLLLSQDQDAEVTDLIFDRLVGLDAQGNFIPEMLQSWTILKGGREVVLQLRPGLTWHDGSPIEAEDIVFTWTALRLPRVRQLADTAGGVATLDSLKAEGPLTVRIRLSQPRGTLLSDLYNFIPVPRRHYQVPAKPLESPRNLQPIGSGPYRVTGSATRTQVHLERWAGYRGIHPGQAPAFELWETKPEQANLLQAFQDGRLHYSDAKPLLYYLVRKGELGTGLVTGFSTPQASFRAYFLNCDPKRSLLGDLTLRQVLFELLPWQANTRAQRFFPTRLATSFWPPQSWAYNPKQRPVPSVARAKELLDAAGWKPGPDGIRQNSQGRRLSLVAYNPSYNPSRNYSSMLSEQAAKVGIQIEIRTLEFSEVIDRASKHEGDIWSFSWTTSLDPDVDSPLFTREGLVTHANYSSYLNPEVDRLFDEGRHTLNQEARRRIYLQISELIYRDKPVIPIDYYQNQVLVHRRLQGVTFSQQGLCWGFWPGRRGWRLGN